MGAPQRNKDGFMVSDGADSSKPSYRIGEHDFARVWKDCGGPGWYEEEEGSASSSGGGSAISSPRFFLKFQFLIERRHRENFGRIHAFPYFNVRALRFKREELGIM